MRKHSKLMFIHSISNKILIHWHTYLAVNWWIMLWESASETWVSIWNVLKLYQQSKNQLHTNSFHFFDNVLMSILFNEYWALRLSETHYSIYQCKHTLIWNGIAVPELPFTHLYERELNNRIMWMKIGLLIGVK